MTIDEFIERLKQRKLSRLTLIAYLSDLRHVEAHINKPLIQATEGDLQKYFTSIVTLSSSSIGRRIAALRQFFIHAQRCGWCGMNPTLNLDTPRKARRIPKYLSQREIDQLMSSLGCNDPLSIRNTAIIKLLYYTGMRIGELQQLDLADILWDTLQLRVRGKGDKDRILPLSTIAVRVLEEWVRVRTGVKDLKTSALFVGIDKGHHGDRISYGAMRHIVKKMLTDVGLGTYSAHKLRHTFATQLLGRGAPLEQISQLLGHARLDTTLIYAHTEPNRLRSAVELLS